MDRQAGNHRPDRERRMNSTFHRHLIINLPGRRLPENQSVSLSLLMTCLYVTQKKTKIVGYWWEKSDVSHAWVTERRTGLCYRPALVDRNIMNSWTVSTVCGGVRLLSHRLSEQQTWHLRRDTDTQLQGRGEWREGEEGKVMQSWSLPRLVYPFSCLFVPCPCCQSFHQSIKERVAGIRRGGRRCGARCGAWTQVVLGWSAEARIVRHCVGCVG